MEKIRFDGVFSFVYSPRKGTPAASYPEQVPESVTKERMTRLLSLQQQIQTEKGEMLIGKTLRALCEGESKSNTDFYSARTDSGKLIHFPKPKSGKDLTGECVHMTVREAKAIMLIGELSL